MDKSKVLTRKEYAFRFPMTKTNHHSQSGNSISITQMMGIAIFPIFTDGIRMFRPFL